MTFARQLDTIKNELTERIFVLFLQKYNGNKSQFARDASVNESSIRDLFNNKQGMTVNMLFKLCYALEIPPSKLIDGLMIVNNTENEKSPKE